ncbi:class F sortase [Streptomyces clavuligerus]|uniref:Secreted protein n=1 Tax=Streptomyces clavuligerus TaxID=1901 RepID=E2Q765_STRCL|nr:class F sortase [Streptomyces clavuligerus]ANW21522.1 class F sortase [Streptomyces clavuligerus]AXU16153.1 class F sortase [Streptomyces clavuligerus]EFG05312.1 Secreted protein [Streptomyces clavuligerus]MBY6306300.1 class F sortase [Streptomyces clavuligerus]QCS08932.1 class F sortase [Streptomyces clavuligerus]
MARPVPGRGTAFTLLSLLLLGVFLLRPGPAGPPAPRPELARPERSAAALPPAAGPLPRSVPRRLAIPSLGLDTALVPVGLDRNRQIQPPPPDDSGPAGWYAGAAAPGERGTAVVVGHVDSPTGPAVFHLLGSLARNSRIEIAREDGATAVFAVDRVETHPRHGFPAERVYRDGPRPELRLITCGGRYTERGGYDSNIVVRARLLPPDLAGNRR